MMERAGDLFKPCSSGKWLALAGLRNTATTRPSKRRIGRSIKSEMVPRG